MVTSADRTDPVSLRRLGLPRLKLSRSVRFTNRFTEQALISSFPYPLLPFRWCRPWYAASCPDSSRSKRRRPRQVTVASGRARPRAARRPSRHHRCPGCTGHRPHRCLSRPLPRTRLLPDLTADGFLSRVGAADHAVAPQAPWTGSGWREHSTAGSGEATHNSTCMPSPPGRSGPHLHRSTSCFFPSCSVAAVPRTLPDVSRLAKRPRSGLACGGSLLSSELVVGSRFLSSDSLARAGRLDKANALNAEIERLQREKGRLESFIRH